MSYELISEKIVKARRPHQCIWCNDPIRIADPYVREISKFDGDFQNHAWHEDCLLAFRQEIAFSDSWECEFVAGDHKRGSIEEKGAD